MGMTDYLWVQGKSLGVLCFNCSTTTTASSTNPSLPISGNQSLLISATQSRLVPATSSPDTRTTTTPTITRFINTIRMSILPNSHGFLLIQTDPDYYCYCYFVLDFVKNPEKWLDYYLILTMLLPMADLLSVLVLIGNQTWPFNLVVVVLTLFHLIRILGRVVSYSLIYGCICCNLFVRMSIPIR